jgi:hypothetical protein
LFDSNALSALNSIDISMESIDQKSASIKFMLTIKDEADLKALGYSNEQIDRLKPQDAADIIKSGTKFDKSGN